MKGSQTFSLDKPYLLFVDHRHCSDLKTLGIREWLSMVPEMESLGS